MTLRRYGRSRRGAATRPVLSTIRAEDHQRWQDRVEVVERHGRSRLRVVLECLRGARDRGAVLLLGSVGRRERYVDLVVALLVRLTVRRTAVVLADCTWSPGSSALPGPLRAVGRLAHRGLVRLLDHPRTTFCVLSEVERARFPRTWGVRRAAVVVTPFCHQLFDHAGDVPDRGDYVFAGGDSLRDYDLLLEAARGLPARVVIATRRPMPGAPPNVVARPMSQPEYLAALAGAGVVAVPLADDGYRSAGQQTYLSAMLLAKPTVVTDRPGVREVVQDGVVGYVVAPEAAALHAALRHCLDPDARDEVDAVSRRARALVLAEHTPERYLSRLLAVAETAARVSSPADGGRGPDERDQPVGVLTSAYPCPTLGGKGRTDASRRQRQ